MDSNHEVLINEADLTVIIPEQSTKAIFWHPFVYILSKNIWRFQKSYSFTYCDFQYMPPLRLLSQFLLDLYTLVINDLESPTKAILKIEEFIWE